MARSTLIVWFRQDLRLEDNPALIAAIERKVPIVPIYIYAPEEAGCWPLGGASKWWLHHSLQSLSEELSDLDLKLVIRSGPTQKVLKDLILETGASSVFWNRLYEPSAIQRDQAIQKELEIAGIETNHYNANLLFEPWTIANKQNKPFQVFTSFWKACQAMPEPMLPLEVKGKALKSSDIESLKIDELRLLPKIHWDKGIAAAWKPGSSMAKSVFSQFLSSSIEEYHKTHDRPDIQGVSRLSPYLHFGEISPRVIWYDIKRHCDLNNLGVQSFLRQLGWREFAYHLLYHFPDSPLTSLKKEFNKFPWNENADELKAWQHGKTGYPIVDAAMRQLWTTGWMHNRLRMIVGSFLVKDLLIPWQKGADWFWDTLVDADLANNTLGWQWVAGCGVDAAPYFRIFNPILQGEKFDPEGVFVRQWVPEISSLPDQWIHKPWMAPTSLLAEKGISLGITYPFPLVDHAEARRKALAAFEQIKTR